MCGGMIKIVCDGIFDWWSGVFMLEYDDGGGVIVFFGNHP